MTHLSDMEELVTSIQNSDIRDYMNEALACYMAKAYRASVVLTFIALFEDVMKKLGELGKVNSKARDIYNTAVKKKAEQEVFETYLIDQLKSNQLLTTLDSSFFETLRNLRNKSAHPSGHHSSAEEARFVFYEATTRFLSKPILTTTQLADQVLEKLNDTNLFPARKIENAIEIIDEELTNIHPETFPYLISKLLEKTLSTNKVVVKNARYFLTGLANSRGEQLLQIFQKGVVQKYASNKSYELTLIYIISALPKLIVDLNNSTYQRLENIFSNRIRNVSEFLEHVAVSHPLRLFISLLDEGLVDLVTEKFDKQLDELIEKYTYSTYLAEKIPKIGVPFDRYFEKLSKNIESNSFDTINKFVENFEDIEVLIAPNLTGKQAFKIATHILRAADLGAYAAIEVRRSHFAAMPNLKAVAASYLSDEVCDACELAESILDLGKDELEEKLRYLQAT
jgi:hypothetical protein